MTGPGATRAAFFALLLAAAGLEAQDLEPRAYSPAPVGTQFLSPPAGRLTVEAYAQAALFTHNSEPKRSFSSGLTTRIAADFDTFGIAYQHSWGG